MNRFFAIGCLILLLLSVPAVAAAEDSFKITGISPSSGPHGSVMDVTITGSGFDSTCQVMLLKCGIKYGGDSGMINGQINSVQPNQIKATFSLTGSLAIVDSYDVRVQKPFGGGIELADGGKQAFTVYKASGTTSPTAATTTTGTTTVTTYSTPSSGENSVFFETNPSGAEIWLNGEDVGTSAFTYYTNRDGTYDVVVKKTGYEDYTAQVTIIRGQRVHFYAPLTQKAFNTTSAPTSVTGSPVKTVTTIIKSTRKMPTPLGTDDPTTPAEESPADPIVALGAAAIAIALVVIRRR
jgi:hypothetical protein